MPRPRLARARPRRSTARLEIGGQEHFYLETQAALAVRRRGRRQCFVHVAPRSTRPRRRRSSRTCSASAAQPGDRAVPAHGRRLRRQGDAGATRWAALAALGAKKTGRPVRVRLTATLDMALTGKRHPFLGALRRRLRRRRHAAGARSVDSVRRRRLEPRPVASRCCGRALFHVDNAYYLPDVESRPRRARRNKTSHTAFRGFGGPQGMLVIEEILDRVARDASASARGRARAQLLPRTGPTRRTTASRSRTPSASARSGTQLQRRARRSPRGAPRSRRSTPRSPHASAASRSRR